MTKTVLLALILSGVTGALAGYLGSLMLTKRMALMGGALGHLTLPGIALALLYDFDVSLGALVFLGLGVSVIWYLEQKTHLHLEALTAVVFSTSLATAFLFLPRQEADIALLGDVSHVTVFMVLAIVTIATGIFLTARHIYSRTVLIGISPDLAASRGIDLRWHNTLYLLCVALTVALGVRIVGGVDDRRASRRTGLYGPKRELEPKAVCIFQHGCRWPGVGTRRSWLRRDRTAARAVDRYRQRAFVSRVGVRQGAVREGAVVRVLGRRSARATAFRVTSPKSLHSLHDHAGH